MSQNEYHRLRREGEFSLFLTQLEAHRLTVLHILTEHFGFDPSYDTVSHIEYGSEKISVHYDQQCRGWTSHETIDFPTRLLFDSHEDRVIFIKQQRDENDAREKAAREKQAAEAHAKKLADARVLLAAEDAKRGLAGAAMVEQICGLPGPNPALPGEAE